MNFQRPPQRQMLWAFVWVALAALVLGSALIGKRPDAEWQPFADQSAHTMATMSVWHDHDLRYTLHDLERFNARFPAAAGPRGAYLKQNAEGELFFAKPPLFALMAAPFYGLMGSSGFVLFNLLALAVMVGLTLHSVRTVYGQTLARLMTAALFVMGPFMAWAMVAHPDLLIAMLLYLGGFLLLTRNEGSASLVAGMLLGLAVSEKPTFVLLLPFLLLSARHTRTTTTAWLAVGLAAGWLAPAALQWSQDGQFLSYQGLRFGLTGAPFPLEPGWEVPGQNTVGHVFDMASLATTLSHNLHLVPEKLFDLLVGRQTGLLPYFPVAAAFLVGALISRQRAALWLVVAFLLHYLLQALIFPTNGFGGAHSYGSRYLMQTLPLLPLALLASTSSTRVKASVTAPTVWSGALAVGLTLVLQHGTLPPSASSVANPSRYLLHPPATWFRLEPSLLPWLPVHEPRFRQPSLSGEASVFLTSGFEQGLQSVGAKGANSTFVLHLHDASQALPALALTVSAHTRVRVHTRRQLVWEGPLAPGQSQSLPIEPAMLQGQAFDLLSQRHVRWGSFSVDWKPLIAGKQVSYATVGFMTPGGARAFPALDSFIPPTNFASQGIISQFQWSQVEPWGMWTDGTYAELVIPLPVGASPPVDVTLRAHALVTAAHPLQVVDVSVNGRLSQTWTFRQKIAQALKLRIDDFPSGRAVLGFRIHHPASPMEIGLNTDPRSLGLGLQGLTLSASTDTR
jgi:4-amino-4-deoxy-L-arabinose transferase-like glycosyltransferase